MTQPKMVQVSEEFVEAAKELLARMKALKTAAWRTPIEQLMYGDTGIVREINEAIIRAEKAFECKPQTNPSEIMNLHDETVGRLKEWVGK